MTEIDESPILEAPYVSIVGGSPFLFVRIPDEYQLQEKSQIIGEITYELIPEKSPQFRDKFLELPQFGTINILSRNGSLKKTVQLSPREPFSGESGVNYEEHPFVHVDMSSPNELIVYFVSMVPNPSKWEMNKPDSSRFELNLKDGMIIDDSDELGLFTFSTPISQSSSNADDNVVFAVAREQTIDPEKKKKVIVNTSNGSVGGGYDDK